LGRWNGTFFARRLLGLRDFDLCSRTSRAGIQIGDLVGAITDKLRFREKEIAGLEDRILAKEARLGSL
jgi:hypothetical protein